MLSKLKRHSRISPFVKGYIFLFISSLFIYILIAWILSATGRWILMHQPVDIGAPTGGY